MRNHLFGSFFDYIYRRDAQAHFEHMSVSEIMAADFMRMRNCLLNMVSHYGS
jgi:hypothetical protein